MKKLPKKVAYLWQLGDFSRCSPDCPKQFRPSFPFYNFFIKPSLDRISGEYTLKIDKLITSIIFDGKHERIVGYNQDAVVLFDIRNFQATVGRFTQVQMKKDFFVVSNIFLCLTSSLPDEVQGTKFFPFQVAKTFLFSKWIYFYFLP